MCCKRQKGFFDIEIESLKRLRDSLDENFIKAIGLIRNCKGKVITTGVGKSGTHSKKGGLYPCQHRHTSPLFAPC